MRQRRPQKGSSSAHFLLISLGLAAVTPVGIAQEAVRSSLASDDAAASQRRSLIPSDYNIRMGSVGLRTELNLDFEYNDNIYRSTIGRQDDFIISPEIRLRTHWQVTRANALTFGVGIGYDFYVQNPELNPERPLISPDSTLAFNIYTGDFKINLHERFYYQENYNYGSYYDGDNVFINVNDTAILARYDNMIGVNVDWDLNDLILSLTYDHENFWTVEDYYAYADRTSEWFTAKAAFLFSPQLQAGLEGHYNFHNYDMNIIPSQQRAGGGPFIGWTLTPRLNLRLGGGYDTIVASGDTAQDAIDQSGYGNWYVYAQINHRLNHFLSHSLMAGHRNEIAFQGFNIEQTFVQYKAVWNIFRNIDVSTLFSVFFADQLGYLYSENYTYFQAGINLGYQIAERWRATLGYSYYQTDSEFSARDYYQNRVRLGITYRF